MNFMNRRLWLLTILLVVAMLLPIWMGPYFPAYDYPNHLLEAQIVVHYDDPQLGYAESYHINSGWYWRTNSLSTLLLVGLGQIMPMLLAGQLVLSLYIILFVGGLALLLRRSGTTWPLLLLAPPLAYNFTFTTGWVNFSYGLALGLFALVAYLSWLDHQRWRDLLWLAGLLLLIYLSHLMVWALLLVVLAAMISVEPYRFRRHGALLLAMSSALPLLLLTRPLLAVAALLIGPLIWVGVALIRWLRIGPKSLVSGCVISLGVFTVLTKLLEPQYQQIRADIIYSEWEKATMPLRLFTLTHQFVPHSPTLVVYNLGVVALVTILTSLLVWSNFRGGRHSQMPNVVASEDAGAAKNKSTETGDKPRWLIALGLLASLYVILPSRTPDIWNTEPRVLLLMALIVVVMVPLPAVGQSLRRAITICALLLCLLTIGGTVSYAQFYNRQAQTWNDQMANLAPAQRVLLLRAKRGPLISRPTLLGSFNRIYDGQHFSVIYTLEYGGFNSIIFNNGPVRPDPIMPIPAYDWPGFSDHNFVVQNCGALREHYEAVLFWGKPDAEQPMAQLDSCFTAGPRWSDMAIWYHPDLEMSGEPLPVIDK